MEMKKYLYLALVIILGARISAADFKIEDMKIGDEGFLIISLANADHQPVHVTEEQKNKTFLVVYIDDLRRAEYKLKYIPESLFAARGRAEWKTNFRLDANARVRAEINLPPIISEIRLRDNRMDKSFHSSNE